MPDANGMILAKAEENDAEVRREDQNKINEFGQLNARLHEVRSEVDNLKKLLEKIDDASTELMMGNGDRVMLRLGEAMFEATEDEATEFCENEVERNQEIVDKLSEEEADILEQQTALKKILYGRFGKSINLEEK
mmetsp:Transcript_20761/g.37271  ORF Transcript_20761/g.37271 Transcript_20761/m.37271 type:complete len:135 (+) Transcript_20761:162-566(+)|eukprot:CAMPEP_0201600896 /NCGR_PEP_ID=MMETSP0492-20130828/1917_1 /ASSEMBLY_ACC=CAM_ASM_000837 /TAXON_ID=420259 /ORGANISM="Thalassiosira gravida, Strain GMp14c1" /LENGTH=134 /DNA_ID=CAMNT_0048063875 /DNA_START=101 /DNA_END=505 /DNA_ORIENTATION=+